MKRAASKLPGGTSIVRTSRSSKVQRSARPASAACWRAYRMEAGLKSMPCTVQPRLASSTAYSPGPHVTSRTRLPACSASLSHIQSTRRRISHPPPAGCAVGLVQMLAQHPLAKVGIIPRQIGRRVLRRGGRLRPAVDAPHGLEEASLSLRVTLVWRLLVSPSPHSQSSRALVKLSSIISRNKGCSSGGGRRRRPNRRPQPAPAWECLHRRRAGSTARPAAPTVRAAGGDAGRRRPFLSPGR